MSIELGDEYVKEAGENIKKASKGSKRDARILFVIAAIVLAAWIGAAQRYGLPDGLMISVTIAVATMCLIMVLNYRTTAIEADIIYVSGAIEWFGQKQIDREDLRDQRSEL